MLQQWEAGKLWQYQLRLQHYSDKSFEDHYFYIVETKMTKEIIIGPPASMRLGLIHILVYVKMFPSLFQP